jgi:IS5 family transposase
MRPKLDPQEPLDFSPSHLKVTREYHEKYRAVDEILTATPEILNIFHQHVSCALRQGKGNRRATFTSDQILRALLVMEIEGLPYRETAVRIDDSHFLRGFVRIHSGDAMDYTLLCKAYKAIPPEAWKKMNQSLGRYALEAGRISGTSLRVDTTACETDVHFPTDASLLWDCYRVLSRAIGRVRAYDSMSVGEGRLQDRKVKRSMLRIARQRNLTEATRGKQRKPYRALLEHVRRILAWSREVRERVLQHLQTGLFDLQVASILKRLLETMQHYDPLVERVLSQATRRVLQGEKVANSEKIFSIFEPHTELLIRGKASKPIEFGHMVLLQQVQEKFITDYEVFEHRPTDESLLDQILVSHRETFGQLPDSLTADKGFYKSMEKLASLEAIIPQVSIAKKGSRTEAERDREHHPIFRALQRFRAGIEGTISALKRAFKMGRCLYRSFRTFCSSVGAHVFAHNLIVLAHT